MKPAKPETQIRNARIYQQAQAGLTVEQLAERYWLSVRRIQTIVWGERKNEIRKENRL